MKEKDMQITVQVSIKAPLQKVWDAYTSPTDIVKWNAASDDWHTVKATVDLREGGQFSSRMEAKNGSFGFDFAGTYSKIIPLELIEYDFGDRHAQVHFKKHQDHVDVEVSFDPETQHSVEQQREGWQAILQNFKKHIEK